MLIGLSIRDVVLIESLDLAIGEGLTALTGETGAGKSIILDALGLATGARADAGLVRRGATGHASATAIFALPADHPAFAYLDDKGLSYARDEDVVLRRQLSPDGRSRAFVNDQATSVGVLKDLGALLLEVHGQHETVGLLDPKTHRGLLDTFGGVSLGAVASAWSAWRAARDRAEALRDLAGRAAAETEELTLRLSELDRLDPREGEEASLAEERALLSSAEKAMADIAAAQDALAGDNLSGRLAQAYRALERARDRALQAGAPAEGSAMTRLSAACEAVDRALVEAQEASAAIDAVAETFEFEPDRLEKAEERLFALRGMARKLNVLVDDLPAKRAEFAARLQAIETSEDSLRAAEKDAAEAREAYLYAAEALSAERRAAGDALAKAVEAELTPLKLEKARFRVAVEPLGEDRAGPSGLDRVAFEIDLDQSGRAVRGHGGHRFGRGTGTFCPGAEGRPGRPRWRSSAVDDLRRGGSGRGGRGRRRSRLAPQAARRQRPGAGGDPFGAGGRARRRALADLEVGRRYLDPHQGRAAQPRSAGRGNRPHAVGGRGH